MLERFLISVLLFGLFIELGTGVTLWVIDFWDTTLFSWILLHLLVGLILWIPLLFYVLPHSFREIGFKFFDFLPPKEQSESKSQRGRLYHFSAILLLLLLFLSFTLGSYLIVVGIPQKREWVLYAHILSGLVAIGLLLFHLRKPLSQLLGVRLGLVTLFFYRYSGEQLFLKNPLIKKRGFPEY